jgi:hypothetical protein
MTAQQPSIGRIVHYRLSEQDINDVFVKHGQIRGSQPKVGDVCAAVVTGVFAAYRSVDAPPALDLRVFVNGPGDLWVTEKLEGTEPAQWCWPPRVGA